MSDFQSDATADLTGSRRQLANGWDVLTEWGTNAGQSYRNAVHTALFSMLDRTLTRTHHVVADSRNADELFVAVRDDLVMKLRVNGHESFDIVYIGAWEDAPGIEFGRL